jgi:hypothetical protein
MRQRAKVASALVTDPRVLVLDEPLNGADPVQRVALIDLFHSLGDQGRTVIVSSHVLNEVERLAGRQIVLIRGRLAAAGDHHAIRDAFADRPRSVSVRTPAARALAARLVEHDAVLGADLRAGTFGFTWLSPVRFPTIVIGRWLGGWAVALVTLVPALVLATVVAGVPEGAGAMAIAAATGSATYIALFVMIGALARRSAVWALAVVFLGERLLGGVLSGIAQISPMWETQQVYAGLARDDGGWRLLRDGTPNGWGAVVRLATILVISLAVASWRVGHLRPTGGDE